MKPSLQARRSLLFASSQTIILSLCPTRCSLFLEQVRGWARRRVKRGSELALLTLPLGGPASEGGMAIMPALVRSAPASHTFIIPTLARCGQTRPSVRRCDGDLAPIPVRLIVYITADNADSFCPTNNTHTHATTNQSAYRPSSSTL